MTAPPRKDQTMKFMMFVVSDAQPDSHSDESDIDLWVDPLDCERQARHRRDPRTARRVDGRARARAARC